MLPWRNNTHKLTIKLKLSFFIWRSDDRKGCIELRGIESAEYACLMSDLCTMFYRIFGHSCIEYRRAWTLTFLAIHFQRRWILARDKHHVTKFLASFFYDRLSLGWVGTMRQGHFLWDEVDMIYITICVFLKERVKLYERKDNTREY